MVRTNEYVLDLKELQRVSLRMNYRKFFWFVASEVIGGIFMILLLPDPAFKVLGFLLIALGIPTPYLRTMLMISRVKKSPIQARRYVAEFDESEMRQLDGGEVSGRIKYADLLKTHVEPEGLVLYLGPINWVLVSRAVFETPTDFETACTLVSRSS